MNSFLQKSSKGGFTLIEILVVIGIIGVLMLISSSNIRDFQRRQLLLGSVKQFVGDLRFAQQLALTGKKPSGCSLLDGYQVDRISSTAYSIYALCSSVAGGSVKISVSKDSILIPNGASISNFGTIIFKELGHGTSLTSPLVITISSQSLTQPVTVNIGGSIESN